MDLSLFYFGDDPELDSNRYRLLLEGARFADERGFAAVWTPERHFHHFGGGYPNPAVLGAALAVATKRVAIRAGSVVAPLHPPVRIAEEWSVVDNLSHGRVGVAFASGWHAVDFAIRPESYARRKDVLVHAIETVRALWRGEEVPLVDGAGEEVRVRTYPTPVQPVLPTWLTSSGSPDTFRAAGRLGMGVLTHLAGQGFDVLAAKVAAYREALAAAHGPAGGPGHVVLMLHTHLGADREAVRAAVREPFTAYLRSSISLMLRASGDVQPDVDPETLSPEDVEFLAERSFDRHFETGGLFGTVDDATAILEQAEAAGVDEVACLIDFVGDTERVMQGLTYLDQLNRVWRAKRAA